MRVRLAPSPTGTLHIGTARTALFNWLFAKKEKGKFLLRIEDTDKERSKEEFTKNILNGLKWLGLQWDEEPLIQSSRINQHREAIEFLLNEKLAYRCYTSENELEEMRAAQRKANLPPRYDNRHRNLSAEEEAKFISEGRSSVIRFRIDDQKPITWDDLVRGGMRWEGKDLGGDMVISRRAEAGQIGDPLYNLVVVVDDSYMKISHVIRGEDHIANTAKQILLYEALGLTQPKFAHTPLILNKDGKKLSKRDGITSISDFKEKGYLSGAMTNYMTLLGWSPPAELGEQFEIREVESIFSFKNVNKAGAKFDWDKLNWLNSQKINSFSSKQILEKLKPLWLKEGWTDKEEQWEIDLVELISSSLTILNDGVREASPFFREPILKEDALEYLKIDGAKQSLNYLLNELEQSPWNGINKNEAGDLITNAANSASVKKGVVMKSLRAALLGELKGPDLITTWSLLARIGNDRSRIRRVI